MISIAKYIFYIKKGAFVLYKKLSVLCYFQSVLIWRMTPSWMHRKSKSAKCFFPPNYTKEFITFQFLIMIFHYHFITSFRFLGFLIFNYILSFILILLILFCFICAVFCLEQRRHLETGSSKCKVFSHHRKPNTLD